MLDRPFGFRRDASGGPEALESKQHKGAPAQGEAVCRHAQSGEEVLWRTATQKMAFGVACRGILGDNFTDKEVEYMFPLLTSISSAMFAMVRIPRVPYS